MSNTTAIKAAAEKPGVSEEDRTNTLNNQTQGRVNFTAATQQPGVVSQQLTDAPGLHFNTSMRRQGGSNDPQGTGP
jgi:hypothetical protein